MRRALSLAIVALLPLSIAFSLAPSASTAASSRFRGNVRKGINSFSGSFCVASHKLAAAGSLVYDTDAFGGKTTSLQRRSSPHMFLASGEDFFGIGTAEAIVIFGVGYFLFGPTEMYKLAKQFGVILGQFKDVAFTLGGNFQQYMEAEVKRVDDEKLYGPRRDLDNMWGNLEPTSADDEDEYEEIYEDGEPVNNPLPKRQPIPDFLSGERPTLDYLQKNVPGFKIPDSVAAKLAADAEPEGEEDEYEDFDEEEFLANERAQRGKIGAPAVSKFMAQMSGEWNRQVMENTGAAAIDATAAAAAVSSASAVASTAVPDLSADDALFEEAKKPIPELTLDEQFERLERIAELEEERALLMQRLDKKFEEKMLSIRKELMDIVDQDYKARRSAIDAEIARLREKKRETVN